MADPPYVNHLATLTVAAAVKQARDDQAAAVRRVEEFHRVTSGRSTWGRARCLPDLVRGCVAAGRLPLAKALLGLGRCLARLGRAEAGPALREAGALFRGLGCGPLLAEAGAWLRRAEPAGP